MLRWLDALGPMKWPSILLVLSPIAAYPFWAEEPKRMKSCGPVAWRGQVYQGYAAAGVEEIVLRPAGRVNAHAPAALLVVPDDAEPLRHDPGTIVLAEPAGAQCSKTS
jgi:hypothetical protein